MHRNLMIAAALAAMLAANSAKAAEMATVQIQLLSTSGAVFNYGLTLNDTGTTNLGTLWYSWIPGLDFLATAPTHVTTPTGWTDTVMNEFPGDGYSIQFVNNVPAAVLTPGHSLSGFDFSSTQTLAAITSALSVPLPFYATGLSYVYIGAPETDAGFSLVAQAVVSVPEPASIGLVAIPLLGLIARRRRSLRRDVAC